MATREEFLQKQLEDISNMCDEDKEQLESLSDHHKAASNVLERISEMISDENSIMDDEWDKKYESFVAQYRRHIESISYYHKKVVF